MLVSAEKFEQRSTPTKCFLDSIDGPGKHTDTVEAICKRNYAPPELLECLSRESRNQRDGFTDLLMRPYEGLSPTTPQYEAGSLTDPPVSVPKALVFACQQVNGLGMQRDYIRVTHSSSNAGRAPT